jgi:hypothetical protein
MTVFPKAVYRLHAIPTTIPMMSFCRHGKSHLQIYMEFWESPNNKKKNNVGGVFIIFNFITYHKATVIKMMWNSHKVDI